MRTPEQVVQGQLDAMNRQDLDAFLQFWWEDAQFFEHPSRLMASGLTQIRAQMQESFHHRSVKIDVVSRVQLLDRVIDHARVQQQLPQGQGYLDVVAIYRVEQERIRAAWFILGKSVLVA